ncbi:hypothetical protein Mapa_012395 [Marchantia paleacea]|nr:hypothetical protein Mapa_012395 [Marchantia paleacea]
MSAKGPIFLCLRLHLFLPLSLRIRRLSKCRKTQHSSMVKPKLSSHGLVVLLFVQKKQHNKRLVMRKRLTTEVFLCVAPRISTPRSRSRLFSYRHSLHPVKQCNLLTTNISNRAGFADLTNM